MKILIDMCLSPDWESMLTGAGWESLHWSRVGDPRAADEEILRWAAEQDHVVFTHDLDFGALLAASGARGPSVIQVRSQDVLPSSIGPLVCAAITQFDGLLAEGALIVVDKRQMRARVLPLRRSELAGDLVDEAE